MMSLLIKVLLLIVLCLPTIVHSQALDRTHINYVSMLDYGADCNTAAVNSTIAAVGSSAKTVFFTRTDRAKAACSWVITSSVTFNLNTTVYIPAGVVVSPSIGVTITFNGPVIVDDYNSLQGAGGVLFTYPQAVKDVRLFRAKCDGATDDTAAIQAALTSGGTISLPAGRTCLANLATINSGVLVGSNNMVRSILLAANSNLILPAGSVLRLDGVRLSSIGHNNVTITGPGAINCINQVYTNDAYTGQGSAGDGVRGCVEFTGIAGAVASQFLLDGVELYGDGTCASNVDSRRGKYGTLISQAKNAYVRNSYIRCFDGEALYAEGGASADVSQGWDEDIWFVGNRIGNTGKDSINFNSGAMVRSGIINNNIVDGAGIEAASGIIIGNTLLRSGIFFGGLCIGGTTIEDNQIDNSSIVVGLNCASAGVGPVIIKRNHVRNSPGTEPAIGLYNLGVGTVQVVDVSDNLVNGWAVLSDGHAYRADATLLGATGRGVFKNNTAMNPGAAFSVGACFSTLSAYDIGDNYCPIGIKAYDTLLGGGRAVNTQLYVGPDTRSVTGTTVETNLRSIGLAKGKLAVSGCVIIHASGLVSGAANTKTIRLYLQTAAGTNRLIGTIVEAAGETDSWRFDATACDNGLGTTVSASVLAYQGLTIEANNSIDSSVTLSMPAGLLVLVTGQVANAGDGITISTMTVMPVMSFPF